MTSSYGAKYSEYSRLYRLIVRVRVVPRRTVVGDIDLSGSHQQIIVGIVSKETGAASVGN